MNSQDLPMLPDHQLLVDHFVAVCQADERVIAALLVGSHASGRADADSDLDLCVITTDDAFDDFLAGRQDFIRRLGEPLFMDDFGVVNIMLSILSDGTDADLIVHHESQLPHIFHGPYRVLMDKKSILAERVFPWQPETRPEAEQLEILRQQIYYFWHDMYHFITALSRGQLWWAQGELEILRAYCLNLTRLQHDFSDRGAGGEPYFKVDQAVAIEQLAPLQSTLCPMEPGAMFQAVVVILRRYQELVPPMAQAHGIAYPADLDRLISARLEKLRDAHMNPGIQNRAF